MSVAKIDVETLRCITGETKWEFCIKLKTIRNTLEELRARVENLLQSLP